MTEKKEIIPSKPTACQGVRHAQSYMLFLAMVFAYGMRVNISMAIVAMTDPDIENSFDWSPQRQSVILSSYFWGYLILQIPAGELAAKFGGKILLTCCIGLNAAVSLMTPLAAHYGGWQMVCACRIVQGLGQGFLLPSIHNLIGQWIPLEERGRLGTIIYSGAQLGTAMQLIASGFIADSWGWPGIFYVNGTLGAIWVAVYIFLGSKSPATSSIISAEEKLYIQYSLGHVGERRKFRTPWKKIFTSLPFISLIIVNIGQNWGLWTLMTEMPSYMKQVLGVDITHNGVMSALPYLAMYLMSFPMGFISDYALKKKWLSLTASRKVSNSIGHWGPAIALIGLSYAPANVMTAVAILSVVVGLNAGTYTGFLLVHIDMAPNCAGTLVGITNCVANIFSLFGPIVAGMILTDPTDPDLWRIVFYISSAIYFVGNLVFVIFGTSERQAWNEPKSDSNDNMTELEKKPEKVV